jgi:hypothetical protein
MIAETANHVSPLFFGGLMQTLTLPTKPDQSDSA